MLAVWLGADVEIVGLGVTVRLSERLPVAPLESVTWTVNVSVVALDPTVPEITPALLRLSPVGSEPEVSPQEEYVPVPPSAAKVAL